MKIPCLIACIFALAAASQSGLSVPQAAGTNSQNEKSEAGCTLRIHVDGLRNSTGKVGTVIFTSPAGWPENTAKSLHHWPTDIPPGKREATAVWEHLPQGDYGVAVIHDENSNHKLDRNFIGIPKEGFGFANNPHVGLSAPSFGAATVHVTCPITEINVHLQYK